MFQRLLHVPRSPHSVYERDLIIYELIMDFRVGRYTQPHNDKMAGTVLVRTDDGASLFFSANLQKAMEHVITEGAVAMVSEVLVACLRPMREKQSRPAR